MTSPRTRTKTRPRRRLTRTRTRSDPSFCLNLPGPAAARRPAFFVFTGAAHSASFPARFCSYTKLHPPRLPDDSRMPRSFKQELVGVFGQPVAENPTQVMIE